MIDPMSTNFSLGGDLVGCPLNPVVKSMAIGALAEKKSLLTRPGDAAHNSASGTASLVPGSNTASVRRAKNMQNARRSRPASG